MSQLLVSQYQREIADLMQFGGSSDESSIRKAFSNLLDTASPITRKRSSTCSGASAR